MGRLDGRQRNRLALYQDLFHGHCRKQFRGPLCHRERQSRPYSFLLHKRHARAARHLHGRKDGSQQDRRVLCALDGSSKRIGLTPRVAHRRLVRNKHRRARLPRFYRTNEGKAPLPVASRHTETGFVAEVQSPTFADALATPLHPVKVGINCLQLCYTCRPLPAEAWIRQPREK
jgi:hypothetical protein